jgi:hypothetical protein
MSKRRLGEAVRMLAVCVLAASACTAAGGNGDDALYAAVLAEARQRLALDTPIIVHPLIARLERGERTGEFTMPSFYAADTVPVFTDESSAYQPCRVAVSGACRLQPGVTSIVVSEDIDIGGGAVMIVVFVTDLRSGDEVQTWYSARVRRDRRGWRVYRFDRL